MPKPLQKQFLRRFRRLILYWLYYVPALIIKQTKIRFVVVSYPNRIGHLAVEIDNYLKLVELGDIRDENPVCLIDRSKAANTALLDIWKPRLTIIENAVLRKILTPLTRYPMTTRALGPLTGFTGVGPNAPATYPLVLKRWGQRLPLTEIPEDNNRSCRAQLERMGLPADAWFVCIHSRDAGWAPKHEKSNHFRNSEINSYQMAADEIIARGGWCVRMGDGSMPPIPQQDRYIDFAVTKNKDPWMDIYLCANTRFFLGNTSGIYLVSTLFNVPSALAHMIPLDKSLGLMNNEISIPKLVRDRQDQLVTFKHLFEAGFGKSNQWSDEYNLKYITQDNSPEEIRDLACDMFDFLDGAEYPEETLKIYQKFRELLGPTEYMHHSEAKFAPSFVRKYKDLF